MGDNNMKHWIWTLLFCMVLLISSITNAITGPSVNAVAAVLINTETGATLYSKNTKAVMAPASTTKIMTAILAIEKGDLEAKVKVSSRAASMPATRMNLRAGEVQSLHDLLYGLMLSSGNDAATAIAEFIAGSETRFAQMMTAKARQLGMAKTSFKNASGLPAANHYTTAQDLAILACYALKNPVFKEIVQTKIATVPSSRSNVIRSLTNHNKLLWQYPYTTGIKTGYTRRAGRCLVASATQSETTLVAVVLKSGNMYNDSINLFDFGFQSIIGEKKQEADSQPTESETVESFTDKTNSSIDPSVENL